MTSQRSDPDRGLAYYRRLLPQCSRLMQTIGAASKAGDRASSCGRDRRGLSTGRVLRFAVASTEARFATPRIDIGLFCSTPMVALSRAVPRKFAMGMLLTGEAVSAEEARRLGLINRVVAPAKLESETHALARFIASKPIQTVRVGKQAFQHQLELSLSSAYDYVGEVMVQNMLDAEAAEGIGAFLDKRPPKWPEL